MKVRLAWVASLVIACTSPALAVDHSGPPPGVVDLAACDLDGSTVRLSWTCVTVNGHAASAYDIRTSATPILTEANFAGATALAGGPTPGLPGTVQTFDVTLSAGQCAWFAMKVSDGVAWSGLSNSGTGCAVEAVADLAPIAGTHMMLVNWTAMGCTQAIGVPTVYDLRYSPSSINAINWGTARTVATDAPLAPGATECAQIFDLLNNTTYYFAIKVGDAQGHWTGLSNLASKRTRISGDFVYDCPPVTTSVGVDPSTALRLTVSPADLGSSELGFTLHCPAEFVGQPAHLRVLDVAGRSVGEWSSSVVAGTEAVVVPVRAGSIHAGVYFAHLTVGSHRADRTVVVTR